MKIRTCQAYRNSKGEKVFINLSNCFGYLGDDGNYYDQFGKPHREDGSDLEYEIDNNDTQPNNAIGWMRGI